MNEQHPTHPDHAEDPCGDDPEVVAELEKLDDIIYPAIEGDEAALEIVEPAWQEALATLGEQAVQESRNEYLRYARSTWDFLRNQTLQHPHRIVAVARILMLLTGDDGS